MNYRFLKYYLVLLLFIIFSAEKLCARDSLNFEKKIIRDSLNNLVINAEKSVHFHISDNPEGKNGVMLQPKKAKDTSLVFQSSGKHKLKYKSRSLNKNIPFYFIVDGIAPITQWHTDSSIFIRQDTIYGGKDFSFFLESDDKYSGVNKIYYSINGKSYKIFDNHINLKKEGSYDIRFFAVDNVGNIEQPQDVKIVIDYTAPESQLEIIGDRHENIISPRSKISLDANDKTGIESIYYSINDEPLSVYSQDISVSHLPEGYHKISYYAEDKIGNVEEKRFFKFFVDKTPPIIIEEIIGDSFVAGGKEYSSGRSQLRINAVDNKAGVKGIYYSINDKEYELYERPVFLSDYSGEINIKTYAVDKVNNKSKSRAFLDDESYMPYVDLDPPKISYEIKGPYIYLRDTLFINDLSKIQLNAKDYKSGVNRIKYRINQDYQQLFEKPFSINKPGYNEISYMAFDNVENSNMDNFAFFIDMQGPEISHKFSIQSYDTVYKNKEVYKVYPAHVKLYLSATDEKTGAKNIFYTINDNNEQRYSKPIKGFEKGKLNNVIVRATDMLGNESIEEISFYLPE